MNELKDLKQEERASFLTYFNDGVLEIVIGVVIVGIYGWLKSDIPASIGAWAAVSLSIWVALKRFITTQRIGIVNFKGENEIRRKRSKQLFQLGIGAFVVTGFLIFMLKENIGQDLLGPFRALPMLPFYLIGIMGLVLLAWNIRLKRYWYLALFLFLVGNVSPFLDSDGLTGFLLVGLVFLGLGGYLMFKFLKTYPKPKMVE